MKNQVAIRLARPSDVNFILNSWLKSYRSSYAVKGVCDTIYYREQKRIIMALVNKPGMALFVASDPDDANEIFGWLCAEQRAASASPTLVVHYAYVKQAFRRLGILRALLETFDVPQGGLMHTHESFGSHECAMRLGSIYNPFLAWSAS